MKIVLTPDWFLGSDVLIEGFSFLVLLIFFFLCYRNYKLNKNKNSKYLGLGFLLIAIAEASTILTKLVLYYDTTFTHQMGQMIITYNVVKSVDIFYYIGFFLHKFFTLLGLYIIFRIPLEKKFGRDFILGLYIIFVSAIFSLGFYYLFHITALILLGLIINNYYEVYGKNKSVNTGILLTAFFMLAFSQIIFIISTLNIFYVIGQLVQLVSYLILLILIIRILRVQKNGRQKKKQNRHNI
jgi:hypothetical protein